MTESKKDRIKRQAQQIANGEPSTQNKAHALPGRQQQPSKVASQSVEQLQQAQGDFQNFQALIAQQLQAMQQATIATARQAAEIKNSMPLLFEQEFAARDAELRGAAQAGFPKPKFQPIAAFEVAAPARLSAAGGNASQRTAPPAIAPGASDSAG